MKTRTKIIIPIITVAVLSIFYIFISMNGFSEYVIEILSDNPCQQNTLESLAFERFVDPARQYTTFEAEQVNQKHDELTSKSIDCNYTRTEWYTPEFHEKIKTLYPEKFP